MPSPSDCHVIGYDFHHTKSFLFLSVHSQRRIQLVGIDEMRGVVRKDKLSIPADAKGPQAAVRENVCPLYEGLDVGTYLLRQPVYYSADTNERIQSILVQLSPFRTHPKDVHWEIGDFTVLIEAVAPIAKGKVGFFIIRNI